MKNYTNCVRTAFAIVLLASGSVWASPTVPALSPADKERALQLVYKLGDRSFKVRQAASGELVRMGRAVESVLRQGMQYPDAEIRERCKHLLPLALSYEREKELLAFLADQDDKSKNPLPGWPRFKELAGNDKYARLLFADLYRAQGEFMETLAKDPASLKPVLQTRCQELMTKFNFGGN